MFCMKKLCFLATFFTVCLVACDRRDDGAPKNAGTPSAQTYTEDWASLAKNNKEPEWFKDAKLGIYFHWGVYSVPAFDSEWYPRWMYLNVPGDSWGGKVYEHHRKTYGPVSEFNYHDFIPMFTAQSFDASSWAELFASAGAKFAGPVATHHDGFAMWDSDVNPWNVKDMGPKKDTTGLLYKELKKRGLKTIATFHHARTLQRYADNPSEWADQGRPDAGWNSHYPYHPDLITATTDPKLRKLYGNMPEQAFHEYWMSQVNEVVDKYSPDIIWFDSWLDRIPESLRRKVVAHHFNHGVSNNQEPLVAYKQEDLPSNVGVLDIEQGGKTEISQDYWLTDITISHGSWCYTEGMGYKEPSTIIRNMIDVWSKRGIVLLNVSPRADGVVPQEQRAILSRIGQWIDKHKEAVYETRAYNIFGYGAAEFEEGHFGGQSATIQYSDKDIRFSKSKDGKSVFVYLLGMPPAHTPLRIQHLIDASSPPIKRVVVVGEQTSLDWSVVENELELMTPSANNMDELATVFRIDFN